MNLEDLKKPFKAIEVEWRVGSTTKDKTKGLALCYLTNRAIMDRLDKVCGQDKWKNEFERWGNGAKCGISIKINDEWVTKYDGASDTNIEATKGGFSDAMKRSAVQWGMGRYLYDLPDIWVDIEPRGKSYVIKNKPELAVRYERYIETKFIEIK